MYQHTYFTYMYTYIYVCLYVRAHVGRMHETLLDSLDGLYVSQPAHQTRTHLSRSSAFSRSTFPLHLHLKYFKN